MFERFSRSGHTAVERASHQTECGGEIRGTSREFYEDSDTDTVADNEAAEVAEVATRRRRLRFSWRDNPTTDQHVRHAESWMQNLALRVGAVPVGAPVPAVIRRQRWSPFNVPLIWGAAGLGNSVPVLEWLVSAASGIREPVQITAARQRPATQSELGGRR